MPPKQISDLFDLKISQSELTQIASHCIKKAFCVGQQPHFHTLLSINYQNLISKLCDQDYKVILNELTKEIKSGQKVTETGLKNIKMVFISIMNQMATKNDFNHA